MSNVDESASRAASSGGGGDQKGRIPKALVILPSTFPANTWLFFRQLNPLAVAERYIHWVKLPQFDKEIPIPCMATALQHASLQSWTAPDVCPMCKWAVDKDPRQVMNRYSSDKPNIQHQWSYKVNILSPIRETAEGPNKGKITGQSVSPIVSLLQITQATLFKAIVAAKDDPELPSDVPLSSRALKLYRGLEPGKEAKDTKYQAGYSASVLKDIPAMQDSLPTEDEIEKVWTSEEFAAFLNSKPASKDDKAVPAQQQGQGGPAGGGAAGGPKVAADDSEF